MWKSLSTDFWTFAGFASRISCLFAYKNKSTCVVVASQITGMCDRCLKKCSELSQSPSNNVAELRWNIISDEVYSQKMQCGNAAHRVNHPNIHKHAQMCPHPLWYTHECAYLQIKTKWRVAHKHTLIHTPAMVMQLQTNLSQDILIVCSASPEQCINRELNMY